MKKPGFATLAIHTEEKTQAVIAPIHLSSTFRRETPDQPGIFSYGRTNNPTRAVLEAQIAALENANWGLAFSSGVAATDAVAKLLRPGDRVVIGVGYGGTFELFRLWEEFGLKVDVRDLSDEKNWNFEGIKLVWVETPTNPWLKLVDLEKIIIAAKKTKTLVAVDNTLSTPYVTKPLDFGADLVVHSATKYLGGHSDLIIGLVAGKNKVLQEKLAKIQESFGAIPGPFESWLASRSIKTLELRVERHCSNALILAERLKTTRADLKVIYPGFTDCDGHQIALKQMKTEKGVLFGGLISLIFDKQEQAKEFCRNLKIFSLAESLGGVESLVGMPIFASHSNLVGTPFAPPASLVRLSIGIENVEDLWLDLEQALPVIPKNQPKIAKNSEFIPALEDPAIDLSPIELERYARLRDWRDDEANKQGISRFVIASNSVLSTLAKTKPSNNEGLSKIKGIGAERLKKYGPKILHILKNCQ